MHKILSKMNNEFVYFFKAINVNGIKIGMTTNEDLSKRLSALKISCPYGGKMVGYIKCENAAKKESELHKRLAHLRLNGEWFNIDENYVSMLINEEENNITELVLLVENWLKKGNNKKTLIAFLEKEEYKELSDEKQMLVELINKNNIQDIPCLHFKRIVDNEIPYFKDYTMNMFGRVMRKLGYNSKINNKKIIKSRTYQPI